MWSDVVPLLLIFVFVMILVHLASRPKHVNVEKPDRVVKQLPTNIAYVMDEDPWGWYPHNHHDPYATYMRRHREYR